MKAYNNLISKSNWTVIIIVNYYTLTKDFSIIYFINKRWPYIYYTLYKLFRVQYKSNNTEFWIDFFMLKKILPSMGGKNNTSTGMKILLLQILGD